MMDLTMRQKESDPKLSLNRRRFLAFAGSGTAAMLLPRHRVAAGDSSPNFVFILSEAWGWCSTSIQMDDRIPESKGDFFHTPNLKQLAEGGIRFTDFYAPSPRCTPSRATFLTGKSPAQLHMTFVSQGRSPGRKVVPPDSLLELPLKDKTIAEMLKQKGYATAHFGKWHMGRNNPTRHGFDESDGANSNGGPDNVRNPNPKQAYGITEKGMNFISRQVASGTPFYVQMSHYGGKTEMDALKETVDIMSRRSQGRERANVGHASVVLDLDTTVGMVMDKLDELGIADNTYVIYTTDHGTPGNRANGILTNGKGSVWEGGIRVPLLIRGPKIKRNSIARMRTNGTDLFPTITELAGIDGPLPDGIEGGSLVSVLTHAGKGKVKRAREEFVVHFPHYDKDPLGPASTILLGKYKLIRFYEAGTQHLFDLSKDIGEQNDLAEHMPEKVKELDRRLDEYLNSVNAQMPQPNPDYDPNARQPEQRGNRGRRGRRQQRDGQRRRGRGGRR